MNEMVLFLISLTGESRGPKVTREPISTDGQRGGTSMCSHYYFFACGHDRIVSLLSYLSYWYLGRLRSLVANWDKRERATPDGPASNISARAGPPVHMLPFSAVIEFFFWHSLLECLSC